MKNNRWIFGVLLMFSVSQTLALVPVVDVKAIIGTMRNIEAIEKLKSLAHADIENLRSEFNSLNPVGFQVDSLSSRSWSPSNWSSALSGSGQGITDELKNFKDRNKDIYEFASADHASPEVVESLNTNSALDAVSTKEFNRLDSYTKKVNHLSNLIQSSSSAKSALDINNKLLVELAYLEIEQIRMATVSNQASAISLHHKLKLASDMNSFLGSVEGS